jgi:hypothetical protein
MATSHVMTPLPGSELEGYIIYLICKQYAKNPKESGFRYVNWIKLCWNIKSIGFIELYSYSEFLKQLLIGRRSVVK